MLPREVGYGHGVTVVNHVLQIVGTEAVPDGTVSIVVGGTRVTGCAIHLEVLTGVLVAVVAPDAHVRHSLVSLGKNVGVVLLILGVGKAEVRAELDAVRHLIVEGHTGGEAVEHLLDDGTGLVVVTGRNAELCLVATTAEVYIELVGLAKLCYLVNPVGVLVVVVVVHRALGVVHELQDV